MLKPRCKWQQQFAVNSAGGEFRLSAHLSQSLSLVTQSFFLTESVSTSPGLGLTNISLIGGSRSANPLGVRFMSRLAFSPRASRMTNSVQFSSIPVPALRLNAGLVHQTTDFGDGPGLLRLQFGVGIRLGSQLGHRHTLRFDAETFRALDESTQSGSSFRVGFDSSFSRFTLSVGLTREHLQASSTREETRSLLLDTRANLQLAEGTMLEARLDLQRSTLRDSYRFSVRWQHRWTQHIDTDMTLGFSHVGQDFALGISARDVFTPGLSFGLGYGLGFADSTATHRLSLSVSYTWQIPFTTPQPVVELFGGRETGAISGHAFQDLNRSFARDAGEPGIAGVLIEAGEFSTVTAGDGSFTLRLPAGPHELTFGGNLPATLGYIGTAEVDIQLGQSATLDLPFAPVSVMQLGVFLDGDRDGVRDASEPMLPGTAVHLSGPLERRVLTGAEGYVWVSGLIEGTYELRVESASLPAGYEVTRALTPVRVNPPENAGPLLIPVGPPVREVVTTFTADALALTAAVSDSNARVGDQLTVWASVHGDADSVTLELFGQRVAMEEQADGRWVASLNVPAPVGLQRGRVEAANKTANTATEIQVFVIAAD